MKNVTPLGRQDTSLAQEDAEIAWCDETGPAADEHPRCGYARKGRSATIEVPDHQIRANLVSAISNEGSVHFMTYTETMTAARFITFLSQLLSGSRRKVFLIVHRLKAHEAKAVAKWVAEPQARRELFTMPC